MGFDLGERVYLGERAFGECLVIEGLGDFSLSRTLDCGQCFRFEPSERFAGAFEGIAHGKALLLSQSDPDELVIYGVGEDEYRSTWRRYFSIDRDWKAIRLDISGRGQALFDAASRAGDIRILTQDRFEALISFIISQCNNIPRIKGLVRALCENYGEKIRTPDGGVGYSFPTPEAIAARPVSQLTALKVGYRDVYIHDAARAACDGILDRISAAECTAEAEKIVLSLNGVGRKVAACVLLFGFSRYDAFPVDVWMRRSLDKYFPGVRDMSVFGPYGGVAQQYLFYCERYLSDKNEGV